MSPGVRDHLGVALACLVLAAFWTWPAPISGELLGLHPDAAGTAWVWSAAGRLWSSAPDALTGYPEGAAYGRPDSFVWMALASLAPGLPPARAMNLCTWLGVACSALAGEALARQLGAGRPYSLLGGLFIFSGLSATALLEGYTYHLINPWLPLQALCLLRAERSWGWGLGAGLCALLGLWSTAWLGLAALMLLAVMLLRSIWLRQSGGGLCAWASLLPLLPGLALYLRAFLAGGGDGRADLEAAGQPGRELAGALLRLLPPTPSVDIDHYAQSAALPLLALSLALCAPALLRGIRGWRGLGLCGLLGLCGALAVELPRPPEVPGAQALGALQSALVRFPERLSWPALLAIGAVAAASLSALAERCSGPWRGLPALLLALALAEPFLLQRPASRQRAEPAGIPSAYLDGQGPLIDLWPQSASPAPAWQLWTANRACYYQTQHRRPIADLCLISPGAQSPRLALQAWANDLLLRGLGVELEQGLAARGYATLVLHAGHYAPPDLQRLRRSLALVDAVPRESRDGGEWILAFDLETPAAGADGEGAAPSRQGI